MPQETANPPQKNATVHIFRQPTHSPRPHCHIDPYPDDGIIEAFVISPLFSQAYDNTCRDQGNTPGKTQPPEKRTNPDLPGNPHTTGQSLKEIPHGIAGVRWRHPIGNVGMKIDTPPVFRRRQIIRRRQNAENISDESIGGHDTADQPHAHYCCQFRRCKRKPGAKHSPGHSGKEGQQ